MLLNLPRKYLVYSVLFLSITFDFSARVISNWLNFENIKHGRSIRITLYKDPPYCVQKIKGRLAPSTNNSLTILVQYGSTKSVNNSKIRKVQIRQDFHKIVGYLTLTGVALGLTQLGVPYADYYSLSTMHKVLIVFCVVTPLWILSSLYLPNKSVYNIPPKHRLQP